MKSKIQKLEQELQEKDMRTTKLEQKMNNVKSYKVQVKQCFKIERQETKITEATNFTEAYKEYTDIELKKKTLSKTQDTFKLNAMVRCDSQMTFKPLNETKP